MSTNLAYTKILTTFHAALFKLIGVATDFTADDGRNFSLCDAESCSPLCALIRQSPAGEAGCRRNDVETLNRARLSRRPQIFRCHAGLIDVTVPLFIRDVFIGALCTGQVLETDPTEESFQAFLARNSYLVGADQRKLREHYFHCKVLTPAQIDALTELVSMVGNYVVESEVRLRFLESVQEKRPIQAARDFIELHYQKNLSIAEIAAKVSLSESHFSHLFKQETGTTPIQYLNRCRIRHAIEMLAADRLSITEIAFRCGYGNLTHFNRMFRQQTGKTPRDYRKKQDT